jgi:hypothetical protein
MPQVKGSAVLASERYLRERFGEPALAAVVAALPESDRALFARDILVSSWYPLEALLRFMREAQRQLGAQEPHLLRRMGRASCDYGLTTVYRIFFRVGSPLFTIGRGARVFSGYYDTGELRPLVYEPRHVVLELVGFTGGAAEFCERIYGWMERTLELAGAKNIRASHPQCLHRGDPSCLFEGSWD